MKMKNIFALIPIIIISLSCDPVSDMKANIENKTAQTLTLDFISSKEGLSNSLQLQPNRITLFQEGFEIGGDILKPTLIEYDSVVIKNQADTILKVYKVTDPGRNIYNVDEYWIASEPSKRVFKYKYEILDEDIE
jgi:hypothetical protein